MEERLTPDFAMVRELETIPELTEQIWPGQPKKNAQAPFVFYIQTSDSEDETLTCLTGLQHTGYALHVVAADYYSLANISGKIKAAMNALTGRTLYRADGVLCEEAVCDLAEITADDGALFFEDVSIRQVSPDLFEEDVFLYRRIYQLDIDYQTERSESA